MCSCAASDPDFVDGVRKLADVLKIPPHPDVGVTLEAVRLLVEERLSESALAAATEKKVTRKKMLDAQLGQWFSIWSRTIFVGVTSGYLCTQLYCIIRSF